eukprot:Nitzschia sp. Nitz4//scaffold335_size18684//16977//18104//NITZ4_008773-RA/size18684-processed-gene-0.2-mRNA-1//1//CDS//3329548285//5767//frame0
MAPNNKLPLHQLPLPLDELRHWIPSDEMYQWLKEADVKAASFQAEMDDNGTDQIANLFRTDDSSDEEGDDKSVLSNDSNASEADFEGLVGRVRVWTSSTTDRDGQGSQYRGVQAPTEDKTSVDQRIVYAISDSWEGYGDILWASSRHLGNSFANPETCRDLLAPLFENSSSGDSDLHPLQGLKVLEMGAGCGVPSLVAMKCGAHVVCTDLDNPNRIRNIAESMERNWREMQLTSTYNENARRARACPFRWGSSTLPVAKSLFPEGSSAEEQEMKNLKHCFNVICATDCLFMPWLHHDLLDGIDELLSPDHGVAILAFCIHEAYSKEHEVWPFVDKAREHGFHVEILPGIQLTPPKKGMPDKQGKVNMLRLRKSPQ